MGKEDEKSKEQVKPEVKKNEKDEELLFLAPPPELLTPVRSTNMPSVWEKLLSNPTVPIGLAVTVFALCNGLRHLYRRDTKAQQKMMRLRVGAQSFTVLAILGGCVFSSMK